MPPRQSMHISIPIATPRCVKPDGPALRRLFFPQAPTPVPMRYAFAAACCSAAFLLRLSLDPFLQDHSPLLLFALAVGASAIRGGFGPGIFSTLLGAVGALYFFPPVGNIFSIVPEYRLTAVFQLVLFLLAGMLLSWLAGELRHLRWKALELANQRNQILESITDGFIALDRDCRLVYLNRVAARLTRRPRDGVAGISIWEEIPELRGTLVEGHFRRVLASREAVCFEYFLLSLDRWFEFHVHPANDGGLTVYFADITDRKQGELCLRDALAARDRALEDVRLLSGLLPICADCKRIRDERGLWHQMETYISGHSDAKFSHGICPECAKRFYDDSTLFAEPRA